MPAEGHRLQLGDPVGPEDVDSLLVPFGPHRAEGTDLILPRPAHADRLLRDSFLFAPARDAVLIRLELPGQRGNVVLDLPAAARHCPDQLGGDPVDLPNGPFAVAPGSGPVGERHTEALPQAVFQAGVVVCLD